jgi:hypothetical protein
VASESIYQVGTSVSIFKGINLIREFITQITEELRSKTGEATWD